MSEGPILNGELERSSMPASGPVRTLATRQSMLPAVPAGTAVAAAGGVIAGAAVLAVIRRAGRRLRRGRRGRRQADLRRVVASRSFLVDLHLLDR